MKSIILIIFTLFSNFCLAQIGLTEKQIIEKQGKYSKKEIKDNSIWIYYDNQIVNDFDKKCPELILYLIDERNGICYLESYSTSKSALNTYIRQLNKIGIKNENNIWIDYKTETQYKLTLNNDIIAIDRSYIEMNSNNLKVINNPEEDLAKEIENLKLSNLQNLKTINELTEKLKDCSEKLKETLEILKEKDKKINQLTSLLNTSKK